MINSNREELNSIINVQQNLMKILFFYIEKIVNSLNITTSTYLKDALSLLEKSQKSLEHCNENVNLLNSLISDFNNHSEKQEVNYENIIIKINNNIAFIEEYIYSLLQYFELSLPTAKQPNENIAKVTEIKQKSKIPDWILNRENCLVISETTGNITLPYYIKDLEDKKDINKSYEKIIRESYTLPIGLFKPTFIARFREAFKLARIKEKKSIIFSLNLATELIFNYNLHPAIITACRNLDELDIYLDCLENNETEKFKCFNIIFEIPPIISKKSSNF